MTINRYLGDVNSDGRFVGMSEHPKGPYVRFEDYAAVLSDEALSRALLEYRRWMPGHSGRIGNETFFVCREKEDGEVEWLARHSTAEAMRDDLDRRTVEAVIRAALNP